MTEALCAACGHAHADLCPECGCHRFRLRAPLIPSLQVIGVALSKAFPDHVFKVQRSFDRDALDLWLVCGERSYSREISAVEFENAESIAELVIDAARALIAQAGA